MSNKADQPDNFNDGHANDAQRFFLNQVLHANPVVDAALILNRRKELLESDGVIVAQVVDESDLNRHVQANLKLEELQKRFWKMDPQELIRGLDQLIQSEFPLIVTRAEKLKLVAQEIPTLRTVSTESFVNKNFFRDFCNVLIAPPGEANKIREAHLRWMRPENNPGYKKAIKAIKSTVKGIQGAAPSVYALEDAWLDEILEFNPRIEKSDEVSDHFIGVAVLVIGALLIVFIFGVLAAMFA